MKYIDVENWGRKSQYENFIGYSNPVVSICTTLDVTALVNRCKTDRLSFFSSFLYIVTKCMNEVDEMKLRISGDKVVLPERIHPSYVVLCDSGELRTCRTCYDPDFGTFYRNSRADIEATRNRESTVYNERIVLDCFYLSCVPWIRFNSVINPYNFTDKEQTSIPRITWGKYYKNGDAYEINLDISVHHALADGIHIAALVNKIESELADLSFIGGAEHER